MWKTTVVHPVGHTGHCVRKPVQQVAGQHHRGLPRRRSRRPRPAAAAGPAEFGPGHTSARSHARAVGVARIQRIQVDADPRGDVRQPARDGDAARRRRWSGAPGRVHRRAGRRRHSCSGPG